MRRLLPSLIAPCAALVLVLADGGRARAQTGDVPEASTTEPSNQAQEAARTCKQAKDHLCAATSALVEDILRDRVPDSTQTGCVPGDQQRRLEILLKGWSNTRSALGQLSAYADGETDRLGPSPGGASPLDRLVQRFAGSEHRAPLAYRRLLVEAMRLVAPAAWRAIRERGANALDAWFAGREPLDPAIVDEARHASQSAVGAAGPPLSAALRLVLSYQLLAQCTGSDDVGASCARARQLQQLLESSGPLIVKRRVQDIWATECAAASPAAVLAWVADLPASQGIARASRYGEVTRAAYAKLYSCYLGAATTDLSFATWLETRLPGPGALTDEQLARLDEIRADRRDAEPEDACARAVRTLQRMPIPSSCASPSRADRDALQGWTALVAGLPQDSSDTLSVCRQYARLLWEGKPATIAGAFGRPPSVEDMIVVDVGQPPTAVGRLRALCAERIAAPDAFPDALQTLGAIARGFGESTAAAPWRIDSETGAPVELPRFDRANRTGPWLGHLLGGASACHALQLEDSRCKECSGLPAGAAYDCAQLRRLDAVWQRRTHTLFASVLLAACLAALVGWGRRMHAARRQFAGWARDSARHLAALGLSVRRDPWRHLLPSRHEVLFMELPREAVWERWGARAGLVRAPCGPRLSGRDIDRAGLVAYRAGAAVGVVVHDDEVTPDLSAVRAILEWAARGGTRAVQIVTMSQARLRWAKSSRDVLDLVEETSLRGDPFELRGRITSSSQFFDRERLVSGLLAAAQGGRWQVITGLRRSGKSSLALEVARRLPGPSAYVDLSAFHHEFGSPGDPARAADGVLRYLCLRMNESVRMRYGEASVPAAFSFDDRIDAAALASWFGALSRACRAHTGGRQPPMLVVLDEIEHALTVGPQRIAHALDVLAITVGRLKGALDEAPERGSPVGVFLCSAPHSLLWAPLATLAGQSIMGSLPSVCVPCLSPEAASSMMKSLGLHQGIRFSEPALERLVAASQGIPLLLRRLGSSVLELLDTERARQGALGAVDVGVEGALEAIARETREGSPLRVWVESEICDRAAPAGAMLRVLARDSRADVYTLRATAERVIAQDFAATGIDRTLAPEETARRVEEAAGVILRLLAETGLLVPVGDLTSPEAYDLPEGALRRVLRMRPSLNGAAVVGSRPA